MIMNIQIMPFLENFVSAAVFTSQFCILLAKICFIVLREGVRNILPKTKKDLKGEIVLITGSGQGIGRKLAIKIAETGAVVVLFDINEKKIRDVAKEIEDKGGKVFWYACDVTSENDVNAKARAVAQEVGDVTILINNAGIMQNLPFLELESARIKQTLEINTLSHFWMIRAFLPSMLKKNRGHIVAISSAAGLIGHVNQTDYSASKWAVIGMMESLSDEMRLKKSDIRFTTICPLTVNTGMNQNPVTRFSRLMPILNTDKAANAILNAIRQEDFLVTIPRRVNWGLPFLRVLPHQVLSEFMDFMEYCRVPNADL